MLLIESSRAYERGLLRGIARYSQLHGPWILSREAPFWEARSRKSLLAQLRSVDGIIMRECSLLPEIRQLRKPLVVSNHATERIDGMPNIVSDHPAIGRMAADHLVERGFRNFAFLGYCRVFWSRQRCEGFSRRVKQAGHSVHVYETEGRVRPLPWKKEQQLVIDWLRALPKPVGLMACIDERSQQVAEACKAAGLSVPDQVAIIGADNDEMICTLSGIPLSSVAIAAEKGGYAAAEELDRLMSGRRGVRTLVRIEPTHVVTRTSTDIVAVEDACLSRATRFIIDNCRRTIYVAEVAKAAGLSRRVLEKRFRTALNRSVNDYIRQCRVNLIIKLLTGSSMTVSDIALHMGFPDAAHIARYFRGQVDMSPAQYRRMYRL